MAYGFGRFAQGEGGGGSGYPSTSVFGTQPTESTPSGAGGRSLGRLFPRNVEGLRMGQQPMPFQAFAQPQMDPLTAALQAQAVGSNPTFLQQRRQTEQQRLRALLNQLLGRR